MRSQIVADGTWVSSIGAWGDLKYSTVADGGCEAASWTLNRPRNFSHPALRPGALIELKSGPHTFWSGELGADIDFEPDKGWSYGARGLVSQGEQAICFDGSLNTTSVPDTAIDEAIARGALDWIRSDSISSASFSDTDETDRLNKVNDLLFAYADEQNKRIRVDGNRVVGIYADPTVPDYYLGAGLAEVGFADEDYASDLYLRYYNGTGYATEHVSDASAAATLRREFPVDATNLGTTTSGKVADVGAGLLAKGRARYAMTQALDVSRLQLTTPGGKPASLHRVRGGHLVRAWDVRVPQGPSLPYFDFVIGRTEHVDGEDAITIAAVGLADRTLTDVLTTALVGAS